MSYRLKTTRPLVAAVQRAAREQIARAITVLSASPPDPGAIHDARKCGKKARSALRLIRDASPQDFRVRSALLRDAGRHLSGSRDAYVVVETLTRRYGDSAGIEDIRVLLQQRVDEPEAACADQQRALELLQVLDGQLQDPAPAGGSRVVRDGWRRTRRAVRRTLRQTKRERTVESFHELRKRLKDCWYHARLLHDFAPKRMRRTIQRAKRITELLGDHHDLTVLDAALASLAVETDKLRQRIAEDQAMLAEEALRRTRRLLKGPARLSKPTR